MKTFLIKLLSWLIYQANTLGKDEMFYLIKNRLLDKYGRFIKYDIQFIEGKKCRSCVGGVHHTIYDNYGHISEQVICWNCSGTGWFKRPVWNILSVIQIGKYSFHKPYKRVYENPDNSIEIIQGYIEHTPAKHAHFAKFVLFLLYEKCYLKRWWKGIGEGYYTKWNRRTWLYNIIHILKHGRNSIPFVTRKRQPYQWAQIQGIDCDTDDLPF